MRKLVSSRLFFFLASAMVCYTSCTKTNDLTAVDVTLKLPRTYFTYTSSELKSAEVILYTGMISLNLDSILNVYGFSAGLIQNTYFTNLTVSIVQPPSATLGWLSSMRATVSDDQTFQAEKQIGSLTNTDPNATSVIVTMNNLNFRPYLTKPGFYLRLYGVPSGQPPAKTLSMFFDGSIQFRVNPS